MTEVLIDDDAVLWAVDGQRASAEDALAALATRPLLLLMHGFGSFEGDLIGLAPHLPAGFVCASPRAPLVAPPPIVNGFAWWPLALGPDGLPLRQPGPAEFVGSGPHAGAVALLTWLDSLSARVAARRGGGTGSEDAGGSVSELSEDAATRVAPGLGAIALLGFSQGGCMVTSLLRLAPERFTCGVNCSGFVAPGAFAGDAALAAARPRMFWGRDPADPVIDDARIALTAEWAPAHTDLSAHLYDGILHGIGAEELEDISSFLRQHVPELRQGGAA